MRTSLPYVVLQAQIKTREDKDLKEFMLEHMRKLSQLNGEQKVRYARVEIDNLLKDEYGKSRCERGCHYCCYQPISASKEESQLIQKEIHKADLVRLQKQHSHFQNGEDIAYADKACAFLKSGECSIYDDRPLICRLTYVENDPEYCHLNQDQKAIKHRPVTKAALVAAAFYLSCPDTELLSLSLSY